MLNQQKTHTALPEFLDIFYDERYEPDSVLKSLSSLFSHEPLFLNILTFKSVESSENFELISDFGFRHQLLVHYQTLEGKKLVEDVFFNFIDSYVTPFRLRNINLVDQQFVDQKIVQSVEFRNLIAGADQLGRRNLDRFIRL